MSIRPAFTLACTATLLGVVVALGARRLATMRQRVDDSAVALVRLQADAAEVRRLRQQQQRVAESKRPPQDVIARVTEALGGAGIPTGRLTGVRPHEDVLLAGRATGGVAYRRQTLRVSLGGIDVGGLGDFLHAWEESQELWTPTRIELIHTGGERSPLYEADILVSTVYVGEGDG